MPLEQIKPAFSFYESQPSSSTSKLRQTQSSVEPASNSPSGEATSLPYYYQSSLKTNQAARRFSQSDGSDPADEPEEHEGSGNFGEASRPIAQPEHAEEEDSGESSPPSPLSPPETNSPSPAHGIRSIGVGGASLMRGRDQDHPYPLWNSRFQNDQNEDSGSNDDLTIHQDQRDQDIFKDARSRQCSHETSNSYSNSYSWYSSSNSNLKDTELNRDDGSALTKLGGVGGVTRSGSWGRKDARSPEIAESRFQSSFEDQDEEAVSDEEVDEGKRDSMQRRRGSTEGNGSRGELGGGIKTIGKRRSIPTPSPPDSPSGVDQRGIHRLSSSFPVPSIPSSSRQENVAPSSSSSSNSKSNPSTSERTPEIPSYSRTSTNSTNSTRFSHSSTNSKSSDSSYTSYGSSNPNAAPSALSLRSVSGSIKSNRDNERNRDSSSSLRSNRSAYSYKSSSFEEGKEEVEAGEKALERNSNQPQDDDDGNSEDTGRRSASTGTTGTEVGTESQHQVPEQPKVDEAENSASVPKRLNGLSTGGFKTVSRGPSPNSSDAPPESSLETFTQSSPDPLSGGATETTSLDAPMIPSSPVFSAQKVAQSSPGPITPATLVPSSSLPPRLATPSISNSSSQSLMSVGPSSQFQFEPPIPRRHSGIYLARTRSALSSRHPTINSRFEHGHGGGRAAARERAALENARQNSFDQKARNLSGSSSGASSHGGGSRSYAASQPASPLILSSSGSLFVSDWSGLSALTSINRNQGSLDSSEQEMRTPLAGRAPLPASGSSSYFGLGPRRGSGSGSTGSTPMPSSHQFSSQTLSPNTSIGPMVSPSSSLSRSVGDRKGLKPLAVFTQLIPLEGTSSGAASVGLGLSDSPAPTPKGPSIGRGSLAASPNEATSKSSIGASKRPAMQRSSTTGHGVGMRLGDGVGQVLRTPTTEEWTRFLAEQGSAALLSGVDFRQLHLAAAYGNAENLQSTSTTTPLASDLQSMPRSRSSSLLPSLGTGAAASTSSISLPGPSATRISSQDEEGEADSDSDSDEGIQISASMVASGNLPNSDSGASELGVLERLRRMSAGALAGLGGRVRGRGASSSRASSSVRGSDLESLNEEDDEDEEAVDSSSEGEIERDLDLGELELDGDAFAANHARHGSSSSLERMSALYEAISRPQSRVTSPIASPFSSPHRPSSPISNRIPLSQSGSGSSFNLSLDTGADRSNLAISPTSASSLSLGSNPGSDPFNNSPPSPAQYQSPLFVNANQRRGSNHSQTSSPNPGGLSFSPSFSSSASGGSNTGPSLLPPPSEVRLTREATLKPGSATGPPSDGAPKSSLASKRDAANASAAERQIAANAFGYPLPPPGTSRCINDFVITADIGRGAYGLVKKVRMKGVDGNPTGHEFVAKYIIKSRILADCWRRHRVLGPIPIEIHVMDQLRRLAYEAPPTPPAWSPEVLSQGLGTPTSSRPSSIPSTPSKDASDKELMPPPAPPKSSNEVPSAVQKFHPNICPMVDFFEDHEFYYMIMPIFGRGQDLFDYVESLPDGLSAVQVRSIFGQVADALSYLHSNSIVHRDIKDENVILNFKKDQLGNEIDTSQALPTAQLIDFGSATHIRPGRLFDTFSGTLDYAAAEILRGEKYGGREQDVWALGVVGYVLLCGECPFWNGEEAVVGLTPDSRAATALQERCFPPPLSDEDPQDDPATLRILADVEGQEDGGGRLCDAADLIARCLELDQNARPTAETICSHKFLVGSKGWRGPGGWLEKDDHRQNNDAVLIDENSASNEAIQETL